MSHFRCTKVSVQVWGLLIDCFVTIRFYGENGLAPSSTLKLKDHPLSTLRDCLFNIFAATFHIGGRSSICILRMRQVVETRTHLSLSNCNKCKIYKLHGLTLVGVGLAVLVNEVTIVVNCYGVVSPSQECCKSDVSEWYCVDITLEFKYWNYFLWGKKKLHIVYRHCTKFSSTILWTILQMDNVCF